MRQKLGEVRRKRRPDGNTPNRLGGVAPVPEGTQPDMRSGRPERTPIVYAKDIAWRLRFHGLRFL